MVRSYDIITFDCYGTLIDWDAGISGALLAAAARRGVTLDRDKVLAAYSRHERAVEAEAFRSYREVLAEAAGRAARELGWPATAEDLASLAESLSEWPPFEDTVPALRRLSAAGFRLGVLSNVDPDLFAGTRRRLEVDFDLVITAADVRSYKPGHAHFRAAQARIAGARWLHAAQSHYHDIIPAQALRIHVAWVNRNNEDLPELSPAPDFEVSALDELLWALGVDG